MHTNFSITTKRPPETTDFLPAKKNKYNLRASFIHGSDAHIEAYTACIDRAESQIIVASWNLAFISEKIFISLMAAKRREVSVSFIVQSVKNESAIDYLDESGSESESDYNFSLHKTKSHAKFLFVDSKTLILGSYNALGDSREKTLDASFMLEGDVADMWPFYMSIYHTYVSIGEDLRSIFGGIAMISGVRNPGERLLLQRSLGNQSRVFFLRTINEHEEFIRLASPYNGNIEIYSPFSNFDNSLKRLQGLKKTLPNATAVTLVVQPQQRRGVLELLDKLPSFRSRVTIKTAKFHQKVVIMGDETICLGSLNWLSRTELGDRHYSNVDLSIVIQGTKAKEFITHFKSSQVFEDIE